MLLHSGLSMCHGEQGKGKVHPPEDLLALINHISVIYPWGPGPKVPD